MTAQVYPSYTSESPGEGGEEWLTAYVCEACTQYFVSFIGSEKVFSQHSLPTFWDKSHYFITSKILMCECHGSV